MKKEFRMSAKSYKLTEKGDLIYLRNFKEKDKLTKKWVKKNLRTKGINCKRIK